MNSPGDITEGPNEPVSDLWQKGFKSFFGLLGLKPGRLKTLGIFFTCGDWHFLHTTSASEEVTISSK